VLRRIFEPKREELMEAWRKLHNEELRNLNPCNIKVNCNATGRRLGGGGGIAPTHS
jgi:hypothetical protein